MLSDNAFRHGVGIHERLFGAGHAKRRRLAGFAGECLPLGFAQFATSDTHQNGLFYTLCSIALVFQKSAILVGLPGSVGSLQRNSTGVSALHDTFGVHDRGAAFGSRAFTQQAGLNASSYALNLQLGCLATALPWLYLLRVGRVYVSFLIVRYDKGRSIDNGILHLMILAGRRDNRVRFDRLEVNRCPLRSLIYRLRFLGGRSRGPGNFVFFDRRDITFLDRGSFNILAFQCGHTISSISNSIASSASPNNASPIRNGS